MNIRDAANLTPGELKAIHVDGSMIQTITYHKGNEKPYRVKLFDCRILECKGHDKTTDLDSAFNTLKAPASNYRLRKYGEFGSTIN